MKNTPTLKFGLKYDFDCQFLGADRSVQKHLDMKPRLKPMDEPGIGGSKAFMQDWRCLHQETRAMSDGSFKSTFCDSKADSGFLCKYHDRLTHGLPIRFSKLEPPSYEAIQAKVVTDLLAVEAKAIASMRASKSLRKPFCSIRQFQVEV